MMRRVLVMLLLLGLPATAGAQPAIIYQQTFDRDGDPFLTAGLPSGAPHTASWAICRPAEPCVDGGSRSDQLSPGIQPAGTTFTYTADDGTTRSSVTSDAWGGRAFVPAPALVTTGLVGTTVGVQPGATTGGWPSDTDHIQIQVCDGTRCEPIADNMFGFPPPVPLEPRDAGKTVQAVVERWGRGTLLPLVLYTSPRNVDLLTAGPDATVSNPVRITPAAAGAVETGIDADGDPQLFSRPAPKNQPFTTAWSICRPNTACVAGYGDQVLAPGTQPAGTTFAADITYRDGSKAAGLSPPWGGAVRSAQLPKVKGQPVVGARMTGVAGTWSGGWSDDEDVVQLQVCHPPSHGGCVVIADPVYGHGRQGVLKPADVGGYVVAFDRRQPASTTVLTNAYGDTRDVPPFTEGPTVALSARVGPVTADPATAVGATVGAALSVGGRRTPSG